MILRERSFAARASKPVSQRWMPCCLVFSASPVSVAWRRLRFPVFVSTALALCGLYVVANGLNDYDRRIMSVGYFMLALFFATTISMCADAKISPRVRGFLSSRPLVSCGKVSYGMYIFHWMLVVVGVPYLIKWQEGQSVATQMAISGTFVVASMVHFTNGRPDKNNYRRFQIKSFIGNDDFRAMEEVVGRRYRRLAEEGKLFPDLVVIYLGMRVNAWTGVKTVDASLIRAGRAMGAKGVRLFFEVLVPGSLPSLIAGYRIAYGRAADDLAESADIPNPGLTTYTVSNLTSGRWFFAVYAVNSAGAQSDVSNVATKTIP